MSDLVKDNNKSSKKRHKRGIITDEEILDPIELFTPKTYVF